ncbi:MAG: SO_0444 family Cu/Zn efflux transporter [Sedimentisphaeraceae bacterium JB056]
MSFINDLFKEFWSILGEMSPYLIFGFAIAGILSVVISADTVRRHLGGSSLGSVVKASIFGIPLPLCSCGVLPVTMSLQKSGAGKGACISFLLSTPQTGVDSIAVTYALLGPVFAIIRPIITFFTGIIGGLAVNFAKDDDKEADVDAKETSPDKDCCCESEKTEKAAEKSKFMSIKAWFGGLKYGFVDLPKDSAAAMLAGLVIAALLTALIPEDFFAGNLGRGPLALIAMVFIGMPIYVCSSASVPIAAAMIMKGLSPGAALVFLMTGPATNAASYTIVWKQFGPRTAITYMLTVIVCAVASGLVVDYLAFEVGIDVIQHSMFMMPDWIENTSAVVLLFILGTGIYKKHLSNKS